MQTARAAPQLRCAVEVGSGAANVGRCVLLQSSGCMWPLSGVSPHGSANACCKGFDSPVSAGVQWLEPAWVWHDTRSAFLMLVA